MLQNTKDYIRSIRKECETNEELIARVIEDNKIFAMVASITPGINTIVLKSLLQDKDFINSL